MKTKEQMIKEAMEQLKNGNVEDVLAQLISQAQSATPRSTRKDRSFVPKCTDITQLRKELKSAYGAKSKMQKQPGAKERYEAQIKMIQARISELYSEASKSPDYIGALLNFNEIEDTVLQELIGVMEDHYRSKIEGKYSKAGLKREAAKYSWSIPESIKIWIANYLGDSGIETYTRRTKREDQRVRTLNRLVKLAENGAVQDVQVQ